MRDDATRMVNFQFSRHCLQSLPADVPGAIGRETGVGGIASVPTGTHHGYGSEESTIAGEVEAQAWRLVVVSVGQIGILGLGHKQGINGLLRLAETCGTHSGG